MTPDEEARYLRAILTTANRLYYAGKDTGISDREFDRHMNRLEQLERDHPDLDRPDSPTHTVGH
jgi:DNA ligase (NAD+)